MADSVSPPFLRRFAPRAGLMLAALLALAWFQRADGRLHVYFPALDGDAALIQTPAGDYVLIDGGADPDALVTALGRRMPFWRHDLELVVLTAADARRLPGQVAALDRYQARRVFAPPAMHPGATLTAWRQRLKATTTPIYQLRSGLRLDLDGATLRVLDADDGMLLRLEYGVTSVVFAHSAAPAMFERPIGGSASLVVYPWQRDIHTPLIEALHPDSMIFSDGERIDPPARQTFHERALGGAQLYHEALDGAIEWVSDGRNSRIDH